MSDELIDIVDESNNLTGERKNKSEAHKNGWWHRAAHVWIYNSKGEIMLQSRAKNKLLFPNVWDVSAAGHVSAGEEPITSAIREIEEEIGLKTKETELKFFKNFIEKAIYNNIINNEFYYVYFLKFDGDIKNLKLQKSEVQEIKFFSIEELEEGLKKQPKKYLPHEKNYWKEIIDEAKRLTHNIGSSKKI